MDLSIDVVQDNVNKGLFLHKPNENKRSNGKFWESFDRIHHHIDGKLVLLNKFVYCKICSKVFNYDSKKGISNLNTHSSSCKEPIRTIRSFITRSNSITYEDKKKLCLLTVGASVKDTRPFSLAEYDGILELLHGCWSLGARIGAVTKEELKKALPSGITVSRNINKLSADCKESLKNTLKTYLETGKKIAFTTDIWQDKYKRISYLCLTAHFYDEKKKELVDMLLALSPMEPGKKKDNVYVREIIWTIITEYGIAQYSQQFIFISDRGGNIRVALKDFLRLNCFPHFIHSTVKYACEIDSIKKVITSCGALVKYFKFNGLNNLLDVTLKSAIKTRFNYVILMMESMHKQYDEIKQVLRERNELIRLRDINREYIGNMINFLNTFQSASSLTESSYKPTLCYVWISICEISSLCRTREDDLTYVKAAKARALNYIETKFVLHKLHRIAAFLNPNYKSLVFSTPSLKERTINDTRQMLGPSVNELESNSTISSTSSTLSNDTNRRSSSGSESSFLSNYYNPIENDFDEVDSYIALKWTAVADLDIFDWWSARKHVFPKLSDLAIQIHGIPASSLHSERHFSKCGFTINDRRCQMNPSTLENLMILNKHHNFKVCSVCNSLLKFSFSFQIYCFYFRIFCPSKGLVDLTA